MPERSFFRWCNFVADLMRYRTTLNYNKRFALAGILILNKE